MVVCVRTSVFFLLLLGQLAAATVEIRPHAQWTFDTPLEEVILRDRGLGFPIYLIRTEQELRLYDSEGVNYKTIPRYPRDTFQINSNKTAFMLVQQHESILADEQETIYSFQVFDKHGVAQYTSVVGVDLISTAMAATLTPDATLLLNIPDQPWLMELRGDDTLLYLQVCKELPDHANEPFIAATKLQNHNEYITAKTCRQPTQADSLVTELSLWSHTSMLGEPVFIAGSVSGMVSLPGTDYYFLELDLGEYSSLYLFDRTNALNTYPWKSWKIQPIDNTAVFVVSDNDLNVVNLGDGTLASTVHPIDLGSVSDACYLYEWGLYLYLRFETFYTEDGRQAFRKFELEGLDRSGRIVHKSSFGTWSYSLPKIMPLGKDLFAIHIHNAVLLYRMELNLE